MSKEGLFTDGSEQFAPKVNSIPLSDSDTSKTGEASIGQLVSNATEQMSQLVRSEVELAKTELAVSAKKGGIGAGLFGVAGTVALYSSFFFFFFLAELLSVWLDRWAAFLIVFLLMIVLAAIVAFVGFKKVKQIRMPEKTIESTKELKNLVPGKAAKSLDKGSGLFT
ncbi:phage holin family protein [Corynebacterium flavescens]|uniref:Membrane protein n=1 Tax=Corynebacterium flavescens TaxID=28028 RepID=A0A1L7CJL6_CORFL|nr:MULTISPECIES: phage holin family protein [Corynebacterium]APT85988.1 membrane protein [Corynebacterium flavescens]KAA8724657.1 phage holin family protein [Corynebacterium flavescens]MDN6099067.1 phage holin family protein [Corynebacterium flavescens]MDN6199494.1 phage holin family protein [Corynebacterium flavescens]MDN6225821.1 phage holin family protein [Corynebacterium flavescens]